MGTVTDPYTQARDRGPVGRGRRFRRQPRVQAAVPDLLRALLCRGSSLINRARSIRLTRRQFTEISPSIDSIAPSSTGRTVRVPYVPASGGPPAPPLFRAQVCEGPFQGLSQDRAER